MKIFKSDETSPSPKTPETDERERRRVEVDKLLDQPLTNRALFVACGYLAEVLSEIALRAARASSTPAITAICCASSSCKACTRRSRVLDSSLDFLETLERGDEIARKEIEKFNDSLDT